MNSIVLFAAAGNPAVEKVTEIAQQFGVTWQLLFSQIFLFILVALALKKWAYGPLLEILEERKKRIAESLSNAERIKAELANAQSKAQEMITQAGQQAAKFVEEARAAAAVVTERERQKAVADAQQILAKAREAGDAELVRLKGELRKEFGRLVVQAASQSTGNILNSEQKTRLADDAVRQLAA